MNVGLCELVAEKRETVASNKAGLFVSRLGLWSFAFLQHSELVSRRLDST